MTRRSALAPCRALAPLAALVHACVLAAACGGPSERPAERAAQGASPDTAPAREPPRPGTPSECYVADRSILARRPNGVAPGPAGLRGWVQLERGAAADGGPALLVDSDGASLGAHWRRGPGDSLLVVGFDDFLRVELRLAVRDSGATGSASAYSDAAHERDSAGTLRDFRREWSVVARRRACAGAPRPTR